MGSDNLENGTNGNSQSSDKFSSPVVQAIASHVGRYYPVVPKAATNTGDEFFINKTHVEKTSSVNHSTDIIFHGLENHQPPGFDNPFFKKEAEV